MELRRGSVGNMASKLKLQQMKETSGFSPANPMAPLSSKNEEARGLGLSQFVGGAGTEFSSSTRRPGRGARNQSFATTQELSGILLPFECKT